MDDRLKEVRFDTNEAEKFFTQIMAYTLGPVELKGMMEENKAIVLDVRLNEDYVQGHIPSAISMPRAQMEERLEELSKDTLYVVYCYNQQCHLGACACRFLATKGYHCMHLEGGFKTWVEDFRFATSKD